MIIINNLETREDIEKYKQWMSTRSVGLLRGVCKMIETDEKFRPGRWKNAQLRIELLKTEISRRKPNYKI